MTRSLRIVLCLVVLAVFGIGVSSAYPQWVEEWGFDFWNVRQMNQELQEEDRRSRELNLGHECIQVRVELRENILKQFMDGQIQPIDVISQFIHLNHTHPDVSGWVAEFYTGETEEIRVAKQICDHLAERLRDHPEAIPMLKKKIMQAVPGENSYH